MIKNDWGMMMKALSSLITPEDRVTNRAGALQVTPVVKNPPASAGNIRDMGLIPGLGRSPGGGHDNQLKYSCLENPMDSGAWWAIVHGVAKIRHY